MENKAKDTKAAKVGVTLKPTTHSGRTEYVPAGRGVSKGAVKASNTLMGLLAAQKPIDFNKL